MFVTVLVAVLALITIGAFIAAIRNPGLRNKVINAGRYNEDVVSSGYPRPIGFAVASLLLVVTLVIAAFNSFYRVDEGESVAVRSVSGVVTRVDDTPGFAAKALWESPLSYQTRTRVAEFTGERATEFRDGNIYSGQFSAQTEDNLTATFDLTVAYSIDGKRVGEIYENYGTMENALRNLLLPALSSETPKAVSQYAAPTFRQQRGEAQTQILEALRERVGGTGFNVETVDIRGIRYGDDVEQRFRDVQSSAAEIEQKRNEVEIAELEGEKRRIESLARADADQIERCGAEVEVVVETIGGVEQEVTRAIPLRGDECQNILNEQVLKVRELDTLRQIGENGNLIIVGGDSDTLLNVPTNQ